MSQGYNCADHYLDCGKDHGRIGMRQPGSDSLANRLSFSLVFGIVVGQRIQDENLKIIVFNSQINSIIKSRYLAPLGALVKRRQQFVNGLSIHLDKWLATGTSLVDLGERSHSIGNDLKVNVQAGIFIDKWL